MEDVMRRWSVVPVFIVVASFLFGCGAGLNGLWVGTGEAGEAKYFDITINIEDTENPVAVFQYRDRIKADVAICGLRQNKDEGLIEFLMDPDARAGSCEAMVLPYRFVGNLGIHVISGKVIDGDGKVVGLFRALRSST